MILSGKNAIVTGGTRGIGFAIADEFASQGAQTVICSRTEDELNTAVNRLNRTGKKVYGMVADVSDEKDCAKTVEFAQSKLGNIDILVNNAGIYGPIGLLEENDPDLWAKTIGTNLLGTVYMSRLVIVQMKKRGSGKITNLSGSGVGGSKALPRFSAYFTSKMSIVGFTECLADELADFNIQVNCVAPGAVNTRLTEDLLTAGPQKAGKQMYENTVMQKKSGGTPPELVAKLVTFLSSDKADHISGRFLSAKWDSIEKLANASPLSRNIYRLRRIDSDLFYEK